MTFSGVEKSIYILDFKKAGKQGFLSESKSQTPSNKKTVSKSANDDADGKELDGDENDKEDLASDNTDGEVVRLIDSLINKLKIIRDTFPNKAEMTDKDRERLKERKEDVMHAYAELMSYINDIIS